MGKAAGGGGWLQSLQGRAELSAPQSDSWGLALSSQMKEVLEAKEREAQKLAEGQREVSAGAQKAAAEGPRLRDPPCWACRRAPWSRLGRSA